MVEFADEEVKKWIEDFKKKVISKYSPERILLFGSRARGDNLKESDIDIIIISDKFEGIKWPNRIADVAELWEGLIAIEPLCYTSKEFRSKKNQLGIVRKAVEEGISV